MGARIFYVDPPFRNGEPSGLEQFGKPVQLLNNRQRPSIFSPQQYCQALADELDAYDFDCETDMIALFGRVTSTAYLIFTLAAEFSDALNVLVFDPQSREYLKLDLSLPVPVPNSDSPA